jgi:Niemann-Pick C1 protein
VVNIFVKILGFRYRPDVIVKDDKIIASRIMAQVNTLKSQEDFIRSLKASYYVNDELNPLKENSFPYSIYYVFFAQYLYITNVAAITLLISTTAVFLTTFILLASPIISIYILLCITMTIFDLLGLMALFDIYVNAVSVVNLVMSIGISVEACVHISQAFLSATGIIKFKKGSHLDRAKESLVEIGSSVFSGIVIVIIFIFNYNKTNLLGVIVLVFSTSEIFQIYYFRMFLFIVILSAMHGLIFLPGNIYNLYFVLLSFVGPYSRNSENIKENNDVDQVEKLNENDDYLDNTKINNEDNEKSYESYQSN